MFKNCPFTKCNCWLAGFGCKFSTLFLLLIRLIWGVQFLTAGWGKLSNSAQVMPFFESLGLPGFMVYVIGTIELLGGLLLVLGLYSRLAALLLSCVMIGAYATAHNAALFNIFGDFAAFTKEAPFLFLMASLTVFSFGPGCWSLDAWKKKKCNDTSSSCCSTESKPSSNSACCG